MMTLKKLEEVTMRPKLSGGKSAGSIEALHNCIFFTSLKAETIQLLYTNIKHVIFQSSDKSRMVLIHINLKEHITIVDKQHKDVQFFSEVIESSRSVKGEVKKNLIYDFKMFCDKVKRLSKIKIDFTLDNFKFDGNWSKDNVTIFPTTNCLVNLTNWPPFILTLNEIEHVHFERVTFESKTFDITFIFKNWNTLLPLTISSIDKKFKGNIQNWLNSIHLNFTSGPRSVHWGELMRVVREERNTFYGDKDEDGREKPVGWLFLSSNDDDDDDDDDIEEEEYRAPKKKRKNH